MTNLIFDDVSHAYWSCAINNTMGENPLGLASVKYCRFFRQVRLNTLIWRKPRFECEYARPRHVLLQCFSEPCMTWETVKDIICNEEKDTMEFDLGGIYCDHIRVICDRIQNVPDVHGRVWHRPETVPFALMDRIEFRGEEGEDKKEEPLYNPPLIKRNIKPVAVHGQEVTLNANEVTFRSPFFSAAFSLRRPLLTAIGWDDMGTGLSKENLTPEYSVVVNDKLTGFSGPILRTIRHDAGSIYWTGEVSVEGNRVCYRNLKAVDAFTLDMEFEIYEKGMKIEIVKKCNRDFAALETDDWRFVWDMQKCITSTMGIPRGINERTGVVPLPALLNAPGHGTVLIHSNAVESLFLQVDTWRDKKIGWTGITSGVSRDACGALLIKKGVYKTTLTFTVNALLPRMKASILPVDVPAGILRNWSSVFGFRPEYGGFSNNAISLNCHMSQYSAADMMAYTDDMPGAPSTAEMMRYTLELALKGGPGYGVDMDNYFDAAPSLLISVGRVQQVKPDDEWIKHMWLYIKKFTLQILDSIDDNGLMLCKKNSGNSGEKHLSTNGWDVIAFGHYDAYSNALAYRALRNMTAIAVIADDREFSQICKAAADKLKSYYSECFYNKETGWLGGWRSRDGQLHDYCFPFINYMAICYGLVEKDIAEDILLRIERKMEEAGLDYFHYGIPANLISIRNEDASSLRDYKRDDGLDEYGIYINGCLLTLWVHYYIRALSIYGFKDKAELVCSHLEESFARNRIVGGMNSGLEFITWEGRACGYEGVLVGQFPVLSAIAIQRGVVEPTYPEWWLE